MAGDTKACANCGKAATKTCVGCKDCMYCSSECQRQDWRLHRFLCKTYANFQTRPEGSFRRAILLPEDDVRPRFIWIPTELEDDGMDYSEIEFDDESGMPETDAAAGSEYVDLNGLLKPSKWANIINVVMNKHGGGQLLDRTIWVAHGDTFMLDGSRPNKSLLHLGYGRTGDKWRGGLIIYAMTKFLMPRFVVDAKTSDLSFGIRGLLRERLMGGLLPVNNTLPAVSVSPNGHMEEVMLPQNHRICNESYLAALTCEVLPLFWRIIEYPAAPHEIPAEDKLPSPAAYLELFGNGQPENARRITRFDAPFGCIPGPVLASTNNILVIRRDLQFLSKLEVQALCTYSKEVLQPLLVKNFGTPEKRDAILDKVTLAHFVDYMFALKDDAVMVARVAQAKIEGEDASSDGEETADESDSDGGDSEASYGSGDEEL